MQAENPRYNPCEPKEKPVNTPLRGLHDDIVRKRQEGLPVREIALLYRVSRQAVYDVLYKAEKEGKKIPWEKKERKTKPCEICGRTFLPKFPKSKTCSDECMWKIRSIKNRKPEGKWSRYELLDLTCHQCGKPFQRTKYQQSISMARAAPKKRDFCSRECYHKALKKT